MDIQDLLASAQGSMRSSYDHGVDAVIDRLGLEHQRTTMDIVLPALAIFCGGLTVGALLGVVFAPKRGEELRSQLRVGMGDVKDRSIQRYERLMHRTNDIDEDATPRARTGA